MQPPNDFLSQQLKCYLFTQKIRRPHENNISKPSQFLNSIRKGKPFEYGFLKHCSHHPFTPLPPQKAY